MLSGDPWTENVIFLFDYIQRGDGEYPEGDLLLGADGGLFGTTENGGNTHTNSGTAYHLAPPTVSGQPWTETVLHSFSGRYHQGAGPQSGLLAGKGGVLYGTTTSGGGLGGTVFQLTPPTTGSGAWTESDLARFGPGTGTVPFSNVIADANSVLYGIANSAPGRYGLVYSLTPPAVSGGPWTLATLYTFQGAPDGASPTALLLGKNGVLYGSTAEGGTSGGCTGGCGTIFELVPPSSPGASWTEGILYSFYAYRSGFTVSPGGLVADANGSLFGTTQGSYDDGTVFQLAPPAIAGGSWTFTILHQFTGTPDGSGAMGNLLLKNGTLYGVTAYGGVGDGGAAFTVRP